MGIDGHGVNNSAYNTLHKLTVNITSIKTAYTGQYPCCNASVNRPLDRNVRATLPQPSMSTTSQSANRTS